MALPDPTLASARRSLRASLRSLRRSISPADRRRAASRVARLAGRAVHLCCGQRIAVYAATPEELDTSELIALALRRGCRVYLPRIDRRRRARVMRFVEIAGRQRVNRFGIVEPEGRAMPSARPLDVVFLPLVGFDRCGARLGIGAGYYDRAFAFRRLRTIWRAPRLVGIGYAVQEVERLAVAAHDVPLDMVITEREVIRCTRA